jgi:hypothetical protein
MKNLAEAIGEKNDKNQTHDSQGLRIASSLLHCNVWFLVFLFMATRSLV